MRTQIENIFGSLEMAVIVALIAILVLLYIPKIWKKIFGNKVVAPAAQPVVTSNPSGKSEERTGIYIGPVTMTLIRVVMSLIFGFVIAGILYGINILNKSNVLGLVETTILALLLSWWFGQKDKEVLKVPEGYAAMLTFMGARLRIYLTEGEYPWTGKNLLFGRSTRVIEPGTNSDGFIFLGDIQIVIWNQGSDGQKNTVLSVVAHDKSTVYANLMIAIKLLDPKKWTDSHNPLLDIAERARSTFRTAAEFFTGEDNPGLKNVLRELMLGKTFLGSFIQKQIGGLASGSVVQDVAGVEMFEIAESNSATDIAAAERQLLEKFKNVSKESMKAIQAPDGTPLIEQRSIDESLQEVIAHNGAVLSRVSIGDITLSKEVADAANNAASEAKQRAAQIASAETIKTTRKILAPTKAQASAPGHELATLIAAAQDNNNVKIVFAPGADSLTRAAIAGASQIGGSNG